MARKVLLLLLLVFAVNTCFASDNDIRLKEFLNDAYKSYLGVKEDPTKDGFYQNFYSEQNRSNWDALKDSVEEYSSQKFDDKMLENIEIARKDFIKKKSLCNEENSNIKSECLNQLLSQMKDHERYFKSTSSKKQQLLFKYYDVYALTYLSVLDDIHDEPNQLSTRSFDDDLKEVTKDYVKFYTANADARSTVDCDTIKIKVEKWMFLHWNDQDIGDTGETWPEDGETISHLRSSKNRKFVNGYRIGGVKTLCDNTCQGPQNEGQFKGSVIENDEEVDEGRPFKCCASQNKYGVDEAFRRIFPKWYNRRLRCERNRKKEAKNAKDRKEKLKNLMNSYI